MIHSVSGTVEKDRNAYMRSNGAGLVIAILAMFAVATIAIQPIQGYASPAYSVSSSENNIVTQNYFIVQILNDEAYDLQSNPLFPLSIYYEMSGSDKVVKGEQRIIPENSVLLITGPDTLSYSLGTPVLPFSDPESEFYSVPLTLSIGTLVWNGSAWTGGENVLESGVYYDIQMTADFGSGVTITETTITDTASIVVDASIGTGTIIDSHTCTLAQGGMVAELTTENEDYDDFTDGYSFTASDSVYGDNEAVTIGNAEGYLPVNLDEHGKGTVDLTFQIPTGKSFVLALKSTSSNAYFDLSMDGSTHYEMEGIHIAGNKTYYLQPSSDYSSIAYPTKNFGSVVRWFYTESTISIHISGENVPGTVKLDLIFN